MRKEWGFVKVFGVFCGFFEAPPGVLGVSTAGLLWGANPGKDLQEGQEFKGFSLPGYKKGVLSCLKYIQMRGILSFAPPQHQKRTRNTWSPLSVKLNSRLSSKPRPGSISAAGPVGR